MQTPPLQAHPVSYHPPSVPLTPRSTTAQEIRTRHILHSQTSLTISAFASLLVQLNCVSSNAAQTRLDRIESFRLDFLCGALMYERPPDLVSHETYSSGGGFSLSTFSTTVASPPPSQSQRQSVHPASAIERGLVAEATIRTHLKSRRVLLEHKNFSSLARVARKALGRTLRRHEPVFIAPGLMRSPTFVEEYERNGWAKPGVRWGNFKPDLIRIEEAKAGPKGNVVWEVVEIKYSNDDREIVYVNYKVQLIFYHLCLCKLLSKIPHLSPSHRASVWLSRDPHSYIVVEKPLALRTNLAFVEHHLFVLLPRWLEAVTLKEWKDFEERRRRLALVPPKTPIMDTPTLAFLDRVHETPFPVSPTKAILHPRVMALSPTKSVAPFQQGKVPDWLARLPPLPFNEGDDDDLLALDGTFAGLQL